MKRQQYSIGEISAMVRKAYRGSGMPWGLAEEAGWAAGWMAMHRLPGVESFAGMLTALDKLPVDKRLPQNVPVNPSQDSGTPGTIFFAASPSSVLCPVAAGVTIGDFFAGDTNWSTLTVGPVSYPVILLPFVDRLAIACRRRITVQWGDLTVITNGDGVRLDGDPSGLGVAQADQVTLLMQDIAGEPRRGVSRRGHGHPAAFKVLQKLAHRTYVPATELSRAAGAGAGRIDDD